MLENNLISNFRLLDGIQQLLSSPPCLILNTAYQFH